MLFHYMLLLRRSTIFIAADFSAYYDAAFLARAQQKYLLMLFRG